MLWKCFAGIWLGSSMQPSRQTRSIVRQVWCGRAWCGDSLQAWFMRHTLHALLSVDLYLLSVRYHCPNNLCHDPISSEKTLILLPSNQLCLWFTALAQSTAYFTSFIDSNPCQPNPNLVVGQINGAVHRGWWWQLTPAVPSFDIWSYINHLALRSYVMPIVKD